MPATKPDLSFKLKEKSEGQFTNGEKGLQGHPWLKREGACNPTMCALKFRLMREKHALPVEHHEEDSKEVPVPKTNHPRT
eukprot:1144377-Pelagomonas_calceolata.AAC.2